MQRLIPMLPVRSMPASVAFYAKLGFAVESRNDHWRWAMLVQGECRLMVDESINQPADAARTTVIYLYPDDLASYHRDVRQRCLDLPDISQPFYGMSEFRIEDPDGNRLWVGQKVDAPA